MSRPDSSSSRGTELVRLERLRRVDGLPLAHDTAWLPADVARPLLDVDFSHTALYDELARTCHIHPDAGSEWIHPTIPDQSERRLLGLQARDAAYRIERLGVATGNPDRVAPVHRPRRPVHVRRPLVADRPLRTDLRPHLTPHDSDRLTRRPEVRTIGGDAADGSSEPLEEEVVMAPATHHKVVIVGGGSPASPSPPACNEPSATSPSSTPPTSTTTSRCGPSSVVAAPRRPPASAAKRP